MTPYLITAGIVALAVILAAGFAYRNDLATWRAERRRAKGLDAPDIDEEYAHQITPADPADQARMQ